MRLPLIVLAASSLLAAACQKGPPEPEKGAEPAAAKSDDKGGEKANRPDKDTASAGTVNAARGPGGGGASADPLGGKFALTDAIKDIKGSGALLAKIETSKGTLQCKLLEEKAPVTVANFVGLARGTRPWKDPITGSWVSRPAYDGTTFHRIIKGFMIQGGDAKGNGTGEPGYVIKDEIWEGARHDRAGLLCMANRGPNTNGAQFFITDAAAAHLDGGYTIFGDCTPVETVHGIAGVPVIGERPQTPVKIDKVTIEREKPEKKG